MKFAILAGTKYKEIPHDFNSIEEVYKLRMIKNNPTWKVVPIDELVQRPRELLTIKPITKKVVKPKLRISATLIKQRAELNNIRSSLIALVNARKIVAAAEYKAKRLLNRDPGCGLHHPDTDYWVLLSIAHDNLTTAIKRAKQRREYILALCAVKHIVK